MNMNEGDFRQPLESAANSLRQVQAAQRHQQGPPARHAQRRLRVGQSRSKLFCCVLGVMCSELKREEGERRVENEVVKLEPCAVRKPTFTVHACTRS